MSGYQRILVAVDFSEEGRHVVEKALQLARQDSARVSFVHVVEYTSSMYAGDIPLPEDLDLDRKLADQAKEKLQGLSAQHSVPDAELRVEIGAPAREIVRVAEETGSDLIVIGSHGRHGLQLLLGSTANGVLHQAKCDVLAVRVGKT